MKKYNVIVNGTSYEVEIEEISESEAKTAKKETTPAKSPVAGGTVITSPIPGTVLDIKVANGAAVKTGDTVVILESMKMENEIKATADGKVSISTTKGASVAAGDTLFSIV